MNQVRLVVRTDKTQAVAIARHLVASLAGEGVEANENCVHPDAVVAIGGDGTVLAAAATALELDIPVCGVNVGRVGYLAEFEESEIIDLAKAIAADTYTIRHHNTLSVEAPSRAAWAINDMVLEKVVSQRIIEVAVRVNDEELATYRTDGLIVATPLGSTAYSLSAGGPVMDPSLDALILTPVAPHSLFARSIVLAPDATVSLVVEVDRPARINVDGRELCIVQTGEEVKISRGPATVKFLSLGRHPFPEAVRDQFGLNNA